MAIPLIPNSLIASAVYCEQDGKYLQRGPIFAEMNFCQNLMGAINSFLTYGHLCVLKPWLKVPAGHLENHGNFLKP